MTKLTFGIFGLLACATSLLPADGFSASGRPMLTDGGAPNTHSPKKTPAPLEADMTDGTDADDSSGGDTAPEDGSSSDGDSGY